MEKIYKKPIAFADDGDNTYCPGCMHSTMLKMVGQVLEELDIRDKCNYVQGVGCDANSNFFYDVDTIAVPHGRACAVASAYKRCDPNTIVWTYQGDGDLAAIGLAETIAAANRGENFTVIFINNGTYGMTGGQMAPTTLLGAKTSTTPYGRNMKEHGAPIKMCELLNTLTAPAYIARVSCYDVATTRKAKEAVKKAFQMQIDGKGFSFVEFVANCPTNWGMTPLESLKHIKETVTKEFPLGEFRCK